MNQQTCLPDAAAAIAKRNITGLTSDEYQRFGSSVVALGNFATIVAYG